MAAAWTSKDYLEPLSGWLCYEADEGSLRCSSLDMSEYEGECVACGHDRALVLYRHKADPAVYIDDPDGLDIVSFACAECGVIQPPEPDSADCGTCRGLGMVYTRHDCPDCRADG